MVWVRNFLFLPDPIFFIILFFSSAIVLFSALTKCIFMMSKRMIAVAALLVFIIAAQALTFEEKKEERPKNLKVLSKNISGEDLHLLMRAYSKALGVRCTFCHVAEEGKPPKFDFASDSKPEKNIARKMITMQNKINKRFLNKIGDHKFEQITCVSCHNGRIKPIVTADSLSKK
jgi:hypothetical protein